MRQHRLNHFEMSNEGLPYAVHLVPLWRTIDEIGPTLPAAGLRILNLPALCPLPRLDNDHVSAPTVYERVYIGSATSEARSTDTMYSLSTCGGEQYGRQTTTCHICPIVQPTERGTSLLQMLLGSFFAISHCLVGFRRMCQRQYFCIVRHDNQLHTSHERWRKDRTLSPM
jgi:hypothetical protein